MGSVYIPPELNQTEVQKIKRISFEDESKIFIAGDWNIFCKQEKKEKERKNHKKLERLQSH